MTQPLMAATFQEFNPDSIATAIETEISLAWAKENPDLFFKAVADFSEIEKRMMAQLRDKVGIQMDVLAGLKPEGTEE